MTILAQTDTWTDIGIPMLVLALIGVGIIVVISQAFAVWKARMAAAQGDAYRNLAEKSHAVQQRIASLLDEVSADMAHVRARTDEVERILKSVEP